jgi:hypothetical protein
VLHLEWLTAVVENRPLGTVVAMNLRDGDLQFAIQVGLIAWITLLAWLLTEAYFFGAQAIPAELRSYGDRFVQAFGRSLIHQRSDAPPIKARLRFVPRSQVLEILIAPNEGRSYPNLTDHRSNLEYDIDRVLALMGRQHRVAGRLYAEGKWIVIPIGRTVS